MTQGIPRLHALAAIIILGALASACAPPPEGADLRGRVLMDGSSTVYPISEAVTEEFLGTHPFVRVTVGVSGTGGGFSKFCSREIDLTAASRPVTEGEVATCEANDVDFVELGVAVDALAVVVNPQNDWVPGDCLTTEQLRAAWDQGSQVRRWSDLEAGWPPIEVKFYAPGHDSGTFDYFTEVINGEHQRSRTSGVLFSEDDNVLVLGVAGDRGSLGYFGYGYYDENRERLKALRIDGGEGCVEPSPRTVAAGAYQPLARPVFMYLRRASLQREEVRAFAEFLMDNVAELATEVGYMPLPEDAADEYRQRLDEALGR